MAHVRKKIYQHLRSAKRWLTKAEEAFDKERDIRGELDLMLAQAELQHVKEVNRSQHWRYRYLAVRHGVALTCAVVIATGLCGIYWWTHNPQMVVPTPLASQVSLSLEAKIPLKSNAMQVVPVSKEQEKETPTHKEDALLVQHSAVQNVVSQQRKVEQPQQVEPSVALSSDEMQKLVRAAGKSLRGQ